MKRIAILLAVLLRLTPQGALGQAPDPQELTWNSERALELIRRAEERRSAATVDTGLVNYQSDARLYVYFYLDRPNSGERNLVKTDQLALDVFWQAPEQVKQRIVGWRNEKSLPTNINYHLDHLTVVLENFGDEIRIGDGDEVRGVPHPAAPGAEAFYDYRLSDSLTLTLPGTTEPLRVYQVQVRPKDPDRPAFVGSVFVDRRAGDLVRMDFTFTRSSYVDRYLDYINIQLDNGLWRGRFWLPNEQRVEIRRRIPELDIPVGSVIRATMRVSNYRFNKTLPPQTFAGPRVVTVPRAQRDTFPFEEELHAEVREEGIGPEVELAEIRREAARLVREQALQRVSGTGLRLPSVSDVFRYNRAEGLVLSAGAGLGTMGQLRFRGRAGYAFGAEHPLAALEAATDGATRVTGSLYLNRPRDIGVGPVASGAINTLSSLFASEDYLDLYFSTGAELRLERRLSPAWSLLTVLRAEEQESAEQASSFSLVGDRFRPLRPIDELDLFVGAEVAVRRQAVAELGRWWTGEAVLAAGIANPIETDACIPEDDECGSTFQGQFLKPQVALGWGRRWAPRDLELRATARAGAALGDLPSQEVYLNGGRGTIPGYPFRAYGGNRFAVVNAALSAELSAPWVRGRVVGALGWTEEPSSWASLLALRTFRPTGGVKPSIGIGAALFHDILWVDLARGLASDGRWEIIVESNPSFWDFL